MGEVTLKISADVQGALNGTEKLDKSIDELNKDTQAYNQRATQGFNQTAQSADALNKEIKEQQKIIKEMSREVEKLAKTQSKHTTEQAQAYKRLQGDLKVANQELKQMQSQQQQNHASASKGTELFKNLGTAIVGAFTIGAILNFGKAAINAWDEQEKANKKLLTALKGNTTATRNLINQSIQLAKVTLFQDEDIVNAQAMVGALIKDENAIKRLMPLIADFASAKGMDLASAADLVAKAVGGEINTLGRYGIQIEGAVGSTARLESAVTGLTEAFGGQAEAAAQTGAAAVQQLSKAWGEFAESIGYLVGPALTDLAIGLTNVTTAATDFINEDTLSKWDKFRIFLNGMIGNTEGVAKILGEEFTPNLEKVGDGLDGGAVKIEKVVVSLDSLKLKLDELKKAQSAAPLEQFASFQPAIDDLERQIALYTKKDEKKAESDAKAKDSTKEAISLAELELEWNSRKVEQEINEDIFLNEQRKKSDEEYRKLKEDRIDWEIAQDVKIIDAAEEAAKKANEEIRKALEERAKFEKEYPLAAALGLDSEEQINQIKEYASQILDYVNELVDQQVEARTRLVEDWNQKIDEQQELVNRENESRAEGLANNYAIEQQNLVKMQKARDQAIKDREKSIKLQRTLSTVESSIALIGAAANIMKGFSGIPIVGVVLGLAAVAAMIAGFIAAQGKVKDATQLAEGGLLTGKRHSQGGIRIPGTNIEVEGDEFVTNRRSTAKYLPLLEAINKDDRDGMRLFFDRKFLTRMPQQRMFDIDKSKRLGEIARNTRRNNSETIYGNGYIIERTGSYTKKINLN